MKNPCCTVQQHMLVVHSPAISWVRASPVVLAIWSCKVKLDEENLNSAGLAQDIGLGSAKLYTFPWLVKREAALCTSRKECNKYDLTATECFWLAHHNDSPRWFAISSQSPPQFSVPVSVLWVGLQKSTQLNLDVKDIFSGSHTEHRWRCS